MKEFGWEEASKPVETFSFEDAARPAAPAAAPARPSAGQAALQILQPGVPGGIASSSQAPRQAISTAPEPAPAPVDQPAAFGRYPGSGRNRPEGPSPEMPRQAGRGTLMGDFVNERVEGDPQARVAIRTRVPIGETPNTAFDPATTPGLTTPGGTAQERLRLQDIGETYRDMPAVVRGAREGIEVMRRQNVGLQIFAADMLGLDAAGDASRANYERSNRATQAMGRSEDFWTRAVESGIASIVGNVQSLAGGAGAGMLAAGRGAGAVASQASTGALASMGTLVFGDEYQAGREYGLSATEATTRALMMTAAEVIGERVGLKRLSESIGDMVRGATTAELPAAIARAVMQYGASQQVGEQLTYALQSGTDKFSPVGINPEMTLAQYIKGAADTAAATLVQAGVMGAGGQAIGMGARALGRRDPAPSATGTIGPGIDLLSRPGVAEFGNGNPELGNAPGNPPPAGAISLLPGAAPAAARVMGPEAPAAAPAPVEALPPEPPVAAAPVAGIAEVAVAPAELPPIPDQVLPVLGEVTSVTLPSGEQVSGAVTGAEQNGAQWEVRLLADDGSRYVFTDQDGIQFAAPMAAPAAIDPVAPAAADLPAAGEPVGAIATAQPAVEPPAPVEPVAPAEAIAPAAEVPAATEAPARAIQTERPKAPPKPTREQLAEQVVAQMKAGNGVSTATVAGAAGVRREEAEAAIKMATEMRRAERKKAKAPPAKVEAPAAEPPKVEPVVAKAPPAPPKAVPPAVAEVPKKQPPAPPGKRRGGMAGEDTPEARASLKALRDSDAPTTKSTDIKPPAWRPVGKGFSARQYVIESPEGREPRQEVRAPNGSIITRGLQPSDGKPFAEMEGEGTLADVLKGVPFKEFQSFFDQQATLPEPAAPVPHANLDGKIVTLPVQLEGGKTGKMRMDAGKAMRDIDDRLAALKALKACIAGAK